MPESTRPASSTATNPWPLVLCLVGVDYFSTLAYLPSMAVEAAGPLAPVAAAVVILVTFALALPVYWYVVGRSPDGRGATGLFEDLIPGWRGKLIVLTLLGFAAADFVITRSLSLADAAVHLIANPHGQRLLARIPFERLSENDSLWPPLASLLHRFIEPRVAITLGLSIVSFALWRMLKRGLRRGILLVAAAAVVCYLALTALVVASAIVYIAQHADIWHAWSQAVSTLPAPSVADVVSSAPASPIWSWLGILLWSFPQMALGLSGFEMIMTVVPQVSGGDKNNNSTPSAAHRSAGRIRNTRKLMLAAAAIMAVYLLSAVTVATLLVPPNETLPGGAAQHRALAYLAHGSPLADAAPQTKSDVPDVATASQAADAATNPANASALNPLFGDRFGDLYDLSTAFILCLAGACVTMGLQNLLPHYLHRLGMEISWAGRVGVIMYVLTGIVLIVTVVFRASPSSQQWAYATSVLVLLAGAALATAKDVSLFTPSRPRRVLLVTLAAAAGGFFLAMTGLTMLINASGLTIAAAFVAAILISSFVSRWIRSTELRFEGFDFADDATRDRWNALCKSGPKVLAPHRPGLHSLAEKNRLLRLDHRLDPATPVIFIEAALGDPSNFYQRPRMKIEREGDLEVIRVCHCVSVSHVLAAICLELCKPNGTPPEIIFGWSHEAPLAANLNFLLLGEGNIPWMVKELVRKATPDAKRQPRIRIG